MEMAPQEKEAQEMTEAILIWAAGSVVALLFLIWQKLGSINRELKRLRLAYQKSIKEGKT